VAKKYLVHFTDGHINLCIYMVHFFIQLNPNQLVINIIVLKQIIKSFQLQSTIYGKKNKNPRLALFKQIQNRE
jgi:hypothetical protein